MKSRRILYGVTAAVTAQSFLAGQLKYLSSQGWEVHLVCGEPGLEEFARTEDLAGLHVVKTKRDPAIGDLLFVFRMVRLILKLRPDVTVMGTPKVGIFGTIAAWIARVPTRVYLIHGYRAEGLSGLAKGLLETLERISCFCATQVVPVSASLKEFLVNTGVAKVGKVEVLGFGSANGVDTDVFTPVDASIKQALRDKWNVPADAEVVTVVGRLTKDKGLQQLPSLVRSLRESRALLQVLIAGTQEAVSSDERDAIRQLEGLPEVHLLGNVDQVQEVFQAADVHLLLSAREGLGMVALEAAACGTPTVAYEATGVVDAVDDNKTGILVSQGDLHGLQSAIEKILSDQSLRQQLADAGVSMANRRYQREDVWANWGRFLNEVALKQETA
ncbi:MAG TPA: glycosyltransferase family 4 protein [Nitrospira sp.]|nr:glycosyltransferase family 4 protein [Nitrospira sp.]HNJ78653.1 glycosyltransferase family 4 protein [Marmoricola sp.]